MRSFFKNHHGSETTGPREHEIRPRLHSQAGMSGSAIPASEMLPAHGTIPTSARTANPPHLISRLTSVAQTPAPELDGFPVTWRNTAQRPGSAVSVLTSVPDAVPWPLRTPASFQRSDHLGTPTITAQSVGPTGVSTHTPAVAPSVLRTPSPSGFSVLSESPAQQLEPTIDNDSPKASLHKSALATCSTSISKAAPMCFRITNIPPSWDENNISEALQTIDPELKDITANISRFPAYFGSTQTALLNLDICTKFFGGLDPKKAIQEKVSSAWLSIDSHFHGLTPLNTPEDEVVADVVAVTGLAGHGFGSWRSRQTHQMWLKDFLPKDITNIRIMTYGYESGFEEGSNSNATLVDYRRNFIQLLKNSRSRARKRPIIFIGHSLGGILVQQTLVDAYRNPQNKEILEATIGLFFFGTPHQGLRTEELERVIDVASHKRGNLILQLREGAEFLQTQKEDMIRVWEYVKRGKVVSFYEIRDTATVRKSNSGRLSRDGPEVEMVKKFSAHLYLSFEDRIPIDKDHTNMVKFDSQGDSDYQTVVNLMQECIG
ncbi:hypothetical protein FN846DRAFT_963294, partial [Sphaerosporella brunnea]